MKGILELILLVIVLVVIGVFIALYTPSDYKELPFFEKTYSNSLKDLSLEKKIGQLFMIGFKGDALSPEIEQVMRKFHPGGILLLRSNIKNENQLKELIDSLQKIALEDTGLPLFIAVDQEGGLVSRIDWVEKTPQSEISDSERAHQIGKKRGEELKELGVNLNLAPLLDITSSGDFIYSRAFQKSPDLTSELAEGLVNGQKESGVLTCIKHFPGYGGISFHPEDKLATLEKVPEFSQFQNIKADMVIISNVIYNEIDSKPFTFSEKGIELLKNNLGSKVLIVSDDLAQNSLLNEFSLEDIVALPIKAGVDILIFSGWRIDEEKGIIAFKEAVDEGKVSEQEINRAVSRIIKLKQEKLEVNNK